MMRLGSMMVVMAIGVGLAASSVVAEQAAPAPAPAPARKLVASVRGEAAVEITAPDTKVIKNDVVTTLRVKNVSSGPIAGFKIDENWYKGSTAVGGDTYRHPRPLPVGEVILVTFSVPRAGIVGARNQYQFAHSNGTVKPKQVKSLDMPKPAPATKKD